MSAHVANGPRAVVLGAQRPWRALGAPIAGIVGLALLLSLSGAFDTDHLAPVRLTVLWLIISTLMVGQSCLLDAALLRVAPPGPLWRVLSAGLAILLTIGLMAVELYALKMTPLPPDVWGYDPFFDLVLFIAPTVAVVAGLAVLLRGAPRRRARTSDEARPATQAAEQALTDWPAEPVLWVRADDHYLEVATAARTLFLRGRMRDAVLRLGPAAGLQVHRSWWVAKAAVISARREGRGHVLVLRDGARAPVGRSRTELLRARGWL